MREFLVALLLIAGNGLLFWLHFVILNQEEDTYEP